MSDPVLVADIGGTNVRFAIAEAAGGAIAISKPQNFRAEDFETIRDAADAYLESVEAKPKRACFAVAAPVKTAEIKFTNSHWRFQPKEIETALRLDGLRVVNDFYALAAGVDFMPADAFVTVKDGKPDTGAPVLVIGPGTGLGQALIVPTPDSGRVIVATEGGHVSFAPRTDEEFEIKKFIAREHPRVSVERILSGRGLVNIHRALCAVEGTQRVSLQANEITKAAIEGAYPIAVKAVDMFCTILGRVAGDAVLATGARGGVVLGGGILPKIKDVFLNSDFVEHFTEKGRMSEYVGAAPVKMIITEEAALYGAAASLQLN
ncbi:glucokinase [Hyphococcus sp.]|uniref:glucokinase n=1 Tax=Hyphococcus sp. TaxID=2038636 RepID=UPI003CCBC1D0